MHIDRARGEISLKIVYYGPPFSGKTTNLQQLHETMDPALRGSLTSLKNNEDRTLFFDYMQVEFGKVGGLTPRFNLYTVPGQALYQATRKIVLRGADAVVFVADSAPAQLGENLNSWRQLAEHLAEWKVDVQGFPVVVQLNKRDLPEAVPVATLQRVLHLNGRACIEAQAIHGIGIRETLRSAIKAALE